MNGGWGRRSLAVLVLGVRVPVRAAPVRAREVEVVLVHQRAVLMLRGVGVTGEPIIVLLLRGRRLRLLVRSRHDGVVVDDRAELVVRTDRLRRVEDGGGEHR